jgi:pilus assembly protein CpaE
MQAVLASDHDAITGRVRLALLRDGLDCPASGVVTVELAAAHIARTQPELVVVVLSPNPERALGVVEACRVAPTARVLAVGPASDPKLVLRALRAGAHDFIDEADLDTEIETALARWRASRPSQEVDGRLISVLAPSGGSGSSTLAANIAAVLAKEHKRAALIDLKLETGDLAALLDLKPTYTLADFCVNAARMDRTLFERTLTRHPGGVHLLAPPRELADIGLVTLDGVRQAVAMARAMFHYVVVDHDHSFREEQTEVLRKADIVLLVLRLDFSSLRNARRAVDHLERGGVGRDRMRVVVNRYGQPKEVPAAKAEEALGMKIIHYVPDEPKTVNRANNNGVPMVIEAPTAKVSKSVAKLAFSVNGQHDAGR